MEDSREKIRTAVLKFIQCINDGNPDDLVKQQTEDFTFIDYDGDVTLGKDGWSSYFRNNPDYRIHVKHVLNSGNGGAIVGRTTGCHIGPVVEKHWTILWTAEVRDGLISLWRIYSDVHEVRDRLKVGQRAVEKLKENERAKFIVIKFLNCINTGDSRGLMALQTEDFILKDYEGEMYQGKDGWEGYFAEYPEYHIHVRHLITSGSAVAVLGRTTGSHVTPEVEENETIIWTAEVRDDLISEWRLYSDTEEIEKRLK